MRLFIIGILAAGFLSLVPGCGEQVPESPSSNVGTEQGRVASEKRVTAEEAAKTALNVGDTMPDFELPDARNEIVRSSDLLEDSNLVLVFYRGGWCPYCNTYLKNLQDNLKQIESANGKLVAISAESPDDSLSTEEKNALKFRVLSDRNLAYARKFGLVYQLPDETDRKYKDNGIDLVVDNDMDKPELPISATYIVKKGGEIVYAFVEPDYKQRAEPDVVIAMLQKLAVAGE